MSASQAPVVLATRGSPLALAQTHAVLAQCRAAFPAWRFEVKIIKTTGDKLQSASLAQPDQVLPKGLFTKELETALLSQEADVAVHSLKDLPTEVPAGLTLGAVGRRADPRDVLVYRPQLPAGQGGAGRGFPPGLTLADLPSGATIATSSTRRKEQLLAQRPDLRVVEIRGNVGTRLRKVAEQAGIDATMLAAAGLARLGYTFGAQGALVAPPATAAGAGAPILPSVLVVLLDPEVMLPAVGQAIVGLESRLGDTRATELCAALNDRTTYRCALAERAFLRAMGGGCQSPVAAYALMRGDQLWLRGVSFRKGCRRGELLGTPAQAESLGERLAAQLEA